MKEATALLVNPTTRTVRAVRVCGYGGIKKLLGRESKPEGNTLCRAGGTVYLQVWADCEKYLVEPAFVCSANPQCPIHGLTVIDALDMKTGEAVDCPVTPEAFFASLEWEEADNRIDPNRPNADWIARFQIPNNSADFVVQYGS
jgi:hypothetical protein